MFFLKRKKGIRLTTNVGAPIKLAASTVVEVVGSMSLDGSIRATLDSKPTIDIVQVSSV